MPCSCRDCQGPWGGQPALQPPLLTLRLCPSQLCSASGPHHTGCHLPIWGGRRVDWQGRQEQAACVRAGVSCLHPVLFEPPVSRREQGSKAWGHDLGGNSLTEA